MSQLENMDIILNFWIMSSQLHSSCNTDIRYLHKLLSLIEKSKIQMNFDSSCEFYVYIVMFLY